MLFALTAIVVPTLGALLGLWLVRRQVPLAVLQEQHEVAGISFAVVGGFYGIILAFVLVASWERFENARATTGAEANALADLYRQADGLADADRAALQSDIIAYQRSIIDLEWPAMGNGTLSPRSHEIYVDIWRVVIAAQTDTDKRVSLFQCLVGKLDDFAEARRDRLLYMNNGLPVVIWSFLIVFGAMTVAFTYFFGMPRALPQAIITAALAATIASTLYIIFEMQTPFSGTVRVPDRAFHVILSYLEPGG